MEFKGILVEEEELEKKGINKELIRRKLEEEGYVIVKKKSNQNVLKTFEEDKTTLVCDKEEIIFRVLLLSSTIARIIVTEKITTIITFNGRKSLTYSFKISRDASMRGIRDSLKKSSSFISFLDNYIRFLKDNNDDAVINWLREFIKEKGEQLK
ncbi:MAG: hypothetical protein RQ872_05130 [Sulfolobaceae archaeon]|nr:hypothetical protein [Sulfolobaceae archaeon]PVU67996.1 hypothetical protein DDW01_01515 [Sulfolobus sp. SCGC AB-777_G05]